MVHGAIGQPTQARELLEARLSRVGDVGERGRWADLLAQCCRFAGNEADHVLANSYYAQARRLKAEAGDWFGETIALQQMARVCLERLDFDGASRVP